MSCILPNIGTAEPAARLDAGTLSTLHQVFDDAIQYRESQLDLLCLACESASGGLCDIHAADLELADRYRDLAATFGIEVDR